MQHPPWQPQEDFWLRQPKFLPGTVLQCRHHTPLVPLSYRPAPPRAFLLLLPISPDDFGLAGITSLGPRCPQRVSLRHRWRWAVRLLPAEALTPRRDQRVSDFISLARYTPIPDTFWLHRCMDAEHGSFAVPSASRQLQGADHEGADFILALRLAFPRFFPGQSRGRGRGWFC